MGSRMQERKQRHEARGDEEVDIAAPIPEINPTSAAVSSGSDSGSESESDREERRHRKSPDPDDPGVVVGMEVDRNEIEAQLLHRLANTAANERLAERVEVMKLDDDDPESAEQGTLGVVDDAVLGSLDVHLEEQVARIGGGMAAHPTLKRCRPLAIEGTEEDRLEAQGRTPGGRGGNGAIGEVRADATLSQGVLEGRLPVDAGREAGGDAIEVVGEEIAAVPIGTDPDEPSTCIDRPEEIDNPAQVGKRRAL